MGTLTTGHIDETGAHWDRVFSALSDSKRRAILEFLETQSYPVSVHRLASVLAARDRDDEAATVTPVERQRALVALRHSHLPTLEAADLVVWDRDGDTAALDPASRELPLFSPVTYGIVHVDSVPRPEP